KAEDVWKYYSNLDKWYIWDQDLENISLHNNDFITGAKGSMKLKGAPEMEFELLSVIENQEFIVGISISIVAVQFGNSIKKNHDGVIVRHEVSLNNNDEKNKGFLSKIFSGVPQSLFCLKKAVEQ